MKITELYSKRIGNEAVYFFGAGFLHKKVFVSKIVFHVNYKKSFLWEKKQCFSGKYTTFFLWVKNWFFQAVWKVFLFQKLLFLGKYKKFFGWARWLVCFKRAWKFFLLLLFLESITNILVDFLLLIVKGIKNLSEEDKEKATIWLWTTQNLSEHEKQKFVEYRENY